MKREKIITAIKYWGQIFLLPIYWLSFFAPRNRKIWVFGSTFGRSFGGNPKYMYLYINQFKRDEIRPVWITHNKEILKMLKENNLEGYYYLSMKGILCCLIAKVYLFDNYAKDILFWVSGGAEKINLWHGTGNKKTNYDNKFDRVRHPRNKFEKFKYALRRISDEKPYHYTLATSQMMAPIFASAFAADIEHIIIEGYPRNDMLFDTDIKNVCLDIEKELLQYIKECKRNRNKFTIYMPTFRQSETLFFEVMDLQAFNEYLKTRKMIFFTKLHPKSKLKDKFSETVYSNIVNIGADVDPYTFLKKMDLLITDYSSIYSDFLMLNRPSVLFPYDFEEYSKDTRECYFEYDEYMPEIKAYTMQELMQHMDSVLEKDTYEEGRLQLRSKMFETADGYSSKRLYQKLREIIFAPEYDAEYEFQSMESQEKYTKSL